jgi:hypothetical protein
VAKKAAKTVGLLKRVSKVYRRLPPKAALVAVKITVGATILYAVEA